MTYYSTAVYCVSDGEAVKIGYSAFVVGRFASFSTNTWREVKPCWAWWGSRDHEAALKEVFSSRCIRNEWFWDGDDVIKSLLPNNMPENGLSWPIKAKLQKALRKKDLRHEPFPGMRGALAYSHERLFETFNQHYQDRISDLSERAGVSLTISDFSPRDGREVEAVLLAVLA